MDEIALDASISKKTLYATVGSKEVLITKARKVVVERFEKKMRRIQASERTLMDALRKTSLCLLDYHMDYPLAERKPTTKEERHLFGLYHDILMTYYEYILHSHVMANDRKVHDIKSPEILSRFFVAITNNIAISMDGPLLKKRVLEE